MTLLAAYPSCISCHLAVFQAYSQHVIKFLETYCVHWIPVDYINCKNPHYRGMGTQPHFVGSWVVNGCPNVTSMEPTSPAWRSKPPFRGSSNGSTIPLPLQRGPDTVTLHDDHAGIFSPAMFTTFPSFSGFGLRSWVSMMRSSSLIYVVAPNILYPVSPKFACCDLALVDLPALDMCIERCCIF